MASCVLRIIHKLLVEHESSPEHFIEQFLEVQAGGKVSANKPPGHTILTYLYSDSRLLKMVSKCITCFIRSIYDSYTVLLSQLLFIIDEGTRQLDQYKLFDGMILYI